MSSGVNQVQQSSMFPSSPHFASVIRREILDDMGQLGGASNARYVLADNSEEYIAKGPSLVDKAGRYVAANELIAARLAGVLLLPMLDHCILVRPHDGELFFGSTFMDQGTYYDTLTEDVFNNCENRELVYDLVVFDAWIVNIDRHHQNLKARKTRPRRRQGTPAPMDPERHRLILNDHSHALMYPGVDPSALAANPAEAVTARHVARIGFIAAAVVDVPRLRDAIERCEAVHADVIRSIVRTVPAEFLPAVEGPDVEAFLIQRQAHLRQLLDRSRSLFPNLGGEHYEVSELRSSPLRARPR